MTPRNSLHDLETRLRAGLQAAGDALPPAPARPLDPADRRPAGEPAARSRRPRTAALAAVAAAVVVVAGVTAVRLTDDDSGTVDVESARATDPPTTADPSTPGGAHDGPGQDPVAGSAVVTGETLVTYGPDGQPGDTVPLAPLTRVQSVVPDRHGGWIACGDRADSAPVVTSGVDVPVETWSDVDPQPDELEERIEEQLGELGEQLGELEATAAEPTVYRFRPGHEPEPIAIAPMCLSGALGVTLVEGRETLLYVTAAGPTVEQFDLASGTSSALAVDVGTPLPGHAAVGGGRIAVLGDTGLRVWDLASGEPVAVAGVDLPVSTNLDEGAGTSQLALSPDGTRLAVLVGDLSSSEVAVIDLATGAELFRAAVPQPVEGDQLSYDGTSVAVGNYYEENGPVRIFDVATGAERTIDAHGILP